ncbi:hypothetical protein V3C99_012704 [Haemonchus contortus]
MVSPAGPPVQGRRGRKQRADVSSLSSTDMDIGRAIELIIGDSSIPAHLKAAMGFLMELKDQMASLLSKNKKLMDENASIRQRNCFVRKWESVRSIYLNYSTTSRAPSAAYRTLWEPFRVKIRLTPQHNTATNPQLSVICLETRASKHAGWKIYSMLHGQQATCSFHCGSALWLQQ